MSTTFQDWFSARPKWLQTAAARLLAAGREPGADELVALADLCLAEANEEEQGFEALGASAFDVAPAGTRLVMTRLTAKEGVNALESGACLDFGESNLVVVYGPNGTGKSGFAKAIKQAAGMPGQAAFQPDVFAPGDVDPTAEFLISEAGAVAPHTWTKSGGPLAVLRGVHVFDTDAARRYLNSSAEASYEPGSVRNFVYGRTN